MADLSIVERIRGVRIETGAHRPFPLDDPARVWFVERGYLDVFATERHAEEIVGRWRFVARVPAGEMAFGCRRVENPARPGYFFGFLAVPSLDTIIVEGECDGIASERFDLDATGWIDEWISRLSEFLVRGRPPPRHARLLEAEPDVPCPAGSAHSAQHGDVIWVCANAPVRLIGRSELSVEAGEPLLPITEQTWFELDTEAEVSAVYTPTAFVTERLFSGFERFGTRVLEFAVLAETEAAEWSRTRRRIVHETRRASMAGALRDLGGVLGARSDDRLAGAPGRTALQTATSLVAASCGAVLEIPRHPAPVRDPVEAIRTSARRSGIRARRIVLDPGWWRRAGLSLVGFSTRGERPLSLLSNDRGTWRALDPDTGKAVAVNNGTAAGVARDALALYAPLPERVEGNRAVLRFSLHRRARDLGTVLAMGALGGLAALLMPILIGQLLVEIIPRVDIPMWTASLGALLLVAFGGAVFDIVRGLALLRIEGRVAERLQTAVWSRLLSLPAPFFRDFTVGDLADRANGIDQVRETLTGATITAAMGGIFSVFSLALLFYYSASLALVVSGLLLVLSGATWFLSRGQLRHHREAFRAQGAIDGFVFQMISGLAKLRVANAESYALARWAQRFAEQKREALAALRWAAGQQAVVGMFRPLALLAIFAFVHYVLMSEGRQSSFDLAAFLSFHAAFGQLTGAVLGLTSAATTAMAVLPLLERVRPILDARPETAVGGIDPGDLTGDIEFANVSFRYSPEGPNALDGVSVRIGQGDYVAFVGPSGCGKSTIYRLLLGFERPASGTVFVDGHDLSGLDPVAVRSHMGVVLQNAQLIAGSIFENIAGLTPLSADEAWEAARAAALEDDIRAMPMEMRTVLPEGGGGLSVGQKQRLLIARALARRPRILLLDEATSALDNRTQTAVQTSLEKLSVTRVVIAHRLSTIRNVDRIYVLEAGRIVESGRYEDLMERGGVFASLSRRQLVQD